jgi:hypothetical protein
MIGVKDVMHTGIQDNVILLDPCLRAKDVKQIVRSVMEGMDPLKFLISLPFSFGSSNLSELLAAVNFLGLSINIQTGEDTYTRLTDVKDEMEGPTFCYLADKDRARTTAAKIVLGLHLNSFDMSHPKGKSDVCNYILFIVSHSRAFGPRLRFHAYNTAKRYCKFSAKQWSMIERRIQSPPEESEDDHTDEYDDEDEEICMSEYDY